MHRTLLNLFLNSCSNNRKSKIQNRKWGGIVAIGVTFAMCGVVAQAQQPKKVPRIGFLSAASPAALSARIEAFRQGLRELGYVEAKNIVIESRYAEGKTDRLPDLAEELVRLKVDVIVVSGGSVTARAAKQATSTIPIVFTNVSGPVESGLVASLARPGGNITGLSSLASDLSGKRLELLRETFPKISRVAVLLDPREPAKVVEFKETQTAVPALGVQLQSLEVRSPKDFESGFKAATRDRAGALLVLQSTITFLHRKAIMELAAKSRLPTMFAASIAFH